MNKEHRLRIAKRMALIGWLFAISGALAIISWRIVTKGLNDQIPFWVIPFFAVGSVIMLVALLLGSRGVGEPLDTERAISLWLGYPCWIAFIVYISLMFISRMV